MTTFPKDPAEQVARVIKDHKKRLTRIEARLDQSQSNRSKDASDISTAKTNITAAQTAITAVNTGSGGTTHENFLGNLSELANQGSITTTGVGTISGSGATNNITNAEFNSVNTQLNSLITSYNALLGHLQSNGFMS